ncbi:hypothetical protein [Streptomyces sp. TLI_235]|uniref:LppU/SCO3897 family protein n=1 Tax=Kitasatospora sp. NPDC085879 TaxID=3154769 RepID=UPI000BD3C1DA|nr:hypothetical protein [Streptomyces sp. TLI_235]PBC78751.1 hypothetical protein BX265_3530 [Streptomyces sp. TLI_235]
MTTPQPPQGLPTDPSAQGGFGPAQGYGQPAAPAYGQPAPGYGQAPGQVPDGYAQAAQQAVLAPKKSPVKKILIGVGTLVLIIAVKIGISFGIGYAAADKPVHAKPGECVKVSGSDNDPKVDTVACGSADANYKVISVVDNSFDPNACNTVEGSTAGLAQQLLSDKFVLCLAETK